MILHTINKSSPNNELLSQCLDLVEDGDCVVLLGDAMEVAKKNNSFLAKFITNSKSKPGFYALQEHIEKRNLQDSLHSEITVIDYDTFLEFALKCNASQSWY